MKTEVLKLDGSARDSEKIMYAVRLLKAGALIAFPTDTIYGLAADATNAAAMQRLQRVKGDRLEKPLQYQLANQHCAIEIASPLSRIPLKLMRLYWPGPLTIVLPVQDPQQRRRLHLDAADNEIGLRIPEHPLARTLVQHSGTVLAITSASRGGQKEPVAAEQVWRELQGEITLVLDGGRSWGTRSSTVVEVKTNETINILRKGRIGNAELLNAIRPTVLFVCTGNTCRSPMAEALFRKALHGARLKTPYPFHVSSCGTDTRNDQPAHPNAVAAMAELEIDLAAHRSKSIEPGDLDRADWIFTMSSSHTESILNFMPECKERIFPFKSDGRSIPDPIGSELHNYRKIRDLIYSEIPHVLSLVTDNLH